MNEKDLPDNVAPNPHSLPYASNIGAPIIKPDHSLGVGKWGRYIPQTNITRRNLIN